LEIEINLVKMQPGHNCPSFSVCFFQRYGLNHWKYLVNCYPFQAFSL